jgi:adenine-specific DNA-methyltransferase
MKYMGSKRSMLLNGLGDLLAKHAPATTRFVDLFAGSGAVAIHVATKYEIPVVASDLQQYSAVLTGAVLERQSELQCQRVWGMWHARAKEMYYRVRPPAFDKVTKKNVDQLREWSLRRRTLPLTKAYGGHFYSPVQATWLDAYRSTLPTRKPAQTVALASLLHVASRCAASPGHTAQPFQPGRKANVYIAEAWARDVPALNEEFFRALSKLYAKRAGVAGTADANIAADAVKETDLVFIDPPYSGVQYSRFYHVLESVAIGAPGEVSGSGRNPTPQVRPHSRYSIITGAKEAFSELLAKLGQKGATCIVTFPAHECSNGLSGEVVRELAREHFRVKEKLVQSKFSTLGGVDFEVGNGRAAKHAAEELILTLSPK